jgi:hypothetical protein
MVSLKFWIKPKNPGNPVAAFAKRSGLLSVNPWITKSERTAVFILSGAYLLLSAALAILAVMMLVRQKDLVTFGVYAVWYFCLLLFRFSLGLLGERQLAGRFLSDIKKHDKLTALLEKQAGAETLIEADLPVSDGYFAHRSPRENILYGDIRASEEDLRRACDTVLLDRGRLSRENPYISEADRQKISLARALISAPARLNLFDALSACDNLTVLTIIKNIGGNYPDITLTVEKPAITPQGFEL